MKTSSVANAAAALLLALCIACVANAETSGWDLRDYKHCDKKVVDTSGLVGDVADITFSPVTNSLWLLVVGKSVNVVEYSTDGHRLRSTGVTGGALTKPRAISWMHDYTFAVIDGDDSEGDDDSSSVAILEANPWRANIRVVKHISVRKVSDKIAAPLGSVSYDPVSKLLVVGNTDADNMRLATLDPETGSTKRILEGTRKGKTKLLDIASIYRAPGEDGVFVLSETSRHVIELTSEGRREAHQATTVTGKGPKGLTFTPDGNFMVTVGENRMDMYTRTESCSYDIPHFVPTLDGGGKVVKPNQHSSSEDDDAEPSDQGFMAYLNVTVTGMDTKAKAEMDVLRAAVAKEIFGTPEAMTLVYAMDDGKFDLTVSKNNRRRLAKASEDVGEVTIVALAETHEHGELLIAKLEIAIGSGSLKKTMHASGLKHISSIEAGGWEVIGADMAPKFFPVVGADEIDDPEPKVMLAHGTGGRNIGWWVFGIALTVLAINLAIGYFAIKYSKKMKKADEMKDRILGSTKSSV